MRFCSDRCPVQILFCSLSWFILFESANHQSFFVSTNCKIVYFSYFLFLTCIILKIFVITRISFLVDNSFDTNFVFKLRTSGSYVIKRLLIYKSQSQFSKQNIPQNFIQYFCRRSCLFVCFHCRPLLKLKHLAPLYSG